jgi:hypothetical protein
VASSKSSDSVKPLCPLRPKAKVLLIGFLARILDQSCDRRSEITQREMAGGKGQMSKFRGTCNGVV